MTNAGNLDNNFGAKKINIASNNATKKQTAINIDSSCVGTNVDEPMKYLGTLGVAQVKMDNKHTSDSVKKSTEKFLQNPDGVEAYIDFCDKLIEKGHTLEEAINKTDYVFKALTQEETYKN